MYIIYMRICHVLVLYVGCNLSYSFCWRECIDCLLIAYRVLLLVAYWA